MQMQTTHVFLYFMCNICLLAYISQCLFSSIHFFLFVHLLYTLHVTLKPIVGPLAHTHTQSPPHIYMCLCVCVYTHVPACLHTCVYVYYIVFRQALLSSSLLHTSSNLLYCLLIRLVVGCSLDCNVYFVVKKNKKKQ